MQFDKYIEGLRFDINHLSKSPFLNNFLEDPNLVNKVLLQKEYLSIINSKPYLSQVRFIERSKEGKEVIRVDRRNEKSFIVQEDSLQSKGLRDYYKEAISYPPDSMFISRIDLNKEYGKLSKPLTPTLRVAQPVFINNEVQGIIVLNTNLSSLYEALFKITSMSNKLSLVNGDGFYLFNAQGSEVFGFEFGLEPAFKQKFGDEPAVIKRQTADIFELEDDMYLLKSLNFPKHNYKVYALLASQRSALLRSYYQWRNKSILIIVIAGIASILIALLYMRKQASQLLEITETIEEFPKNLDSVKLDLKRDDEIGALANSFNAMAALINDNVEMLKVEKSKAEQAVKEKNEFLENMSHEIRNPLQSIIGMSEILEKNNPASHQHNIIKSIRTNSVNLHSLVTDILDYNSMIRNRISLHNEWFSPSELIDELIHIHAYAATSKKIKIISAISDETKKVSIYLDRIRLTQVLNNLITNAIKYSPESTLILINLNGNVIGENVRLKFSVKDEGPGMDKVLVSKIKSRYFAGNNTHSFKDSFGIGLNIVVEILKAFNSQLEIESTLAQGSRFHFEINCPFKTTKDESQVSTINVLPKGKLKNMRMLIIEDDPQVLSLYEYLFEQEVSKLILTDFNKKQEELVGSKFDIILSDYKLGKRTILNHLDTIKNLTADPALFYIISAKTEMPQGISDIPYFKSFIQKPFHPQKLFDIIVNDVLTEKYGQADISSIKEDYDHNKSKYEEAIKLLINEWISLRKRFTQAIHSRDEEELHAIQHKIITTVRRLNLNKFETYLDNNLADVKSMDTEKTAEEIDEFMQFYLYSLSRNIT